MRDYMNDDFETLDEELENENLSEEIDESLDDENDNQLEENNINYHDISNSSEQSNNQNLSNSMKELAKSTAITGTTAIGANAYNKFSQTNLGRNLISKGQNTLNAINQSNNPLAKIAANKANRMVNPLRGISNNNSTPNTDSTDGLNNLPKKDELPSRDSIDEKSQGVNNILKGKGDTNNVLSGLIGGKKGGASSISGNKKLFLLKLKLIGILVGILGIVFIFLFIWFVIDGDEQNFLELTNWNISSNPSQTGTVESGTDFSSSDNEVLSVSLGEKIGEDGITELTDKINNAGNNQCNGINVAQKAVTLIDEVGKIGYKIPYSNISSEYKVIDPDWGKTIDGNIVGLNEYGLINWAINSANINNPITNIRDYNDRSNIIDLAYGNPGNLVINEDKAYIIVQNTGENVTVAYIDASGLGYKKYTYQELTSYTVIDMSSYYSANCKN